MFSNTIALFGAENENNATALNVVDTDNGRTLRRKNHGNGHFSRFTISSTTSNENSPVLTDRFLVRMDRELPDPVTQKPVVGSAYLVLGVPRSANFAKSDIMMQVLGLIEFLLNPDAIPTDATPALTPDQMNAVKATLVRIIDGES